MDKKHKHTRINWDKVIETVKYEILPFFKKENVKPTLRTIFYALVSRNIIPNTKSSYKSLSRKLVSARKKEIFEFDFIIDKTRTVYNYFNDFILMSDELNFVEKTCKERVALIESDISSFIRKMIDDYFDYIAPLSDIGYWARQKNIVEIWIEKEALADTIANWVREKHVTVRVCKGYPSWTFIYENIKEIKELLKSHENVIILYLGDYDPSGIDIERFIKDAMKHFSVSNVEFVRLAVTPEQILKYNLPPRPEDIITLRKLERDTRSKKYKLDYIVELDALMSYVPREFKSLIINKIEEYHDKETYKKVKKESEEIVKRCKEIVDKYKDIVYNKIISKLS